MKKRPTNTANLMLSLVAAATVAPVPEMIVQMNEAAKDASKNVNQLLDPNYAQNVAKLFQSQKCKNQKDIKFQKQKDKSHQRSAFRGR